MRSSAVPQTRLAALAGATILLLAGCLLGGCASPPKEVCDQNFCTGPAYSPDTATQIENGVVAVLSAIGVVPIVPRSANGPARRTVGE